MSDFALSHRPAKVNAKDGRSRESRLMRRVRADLTKHLGGKPSAAQRALVERAAWLTLYVARLDEKALERGTMTDHDARQYLAWSNSLTRTLRALGLKGEPPKPPSLKDIDWSATRATTPRAA